MKVCVKANGILDLASSCVNRKFVTFTRGSLGDDPLEMWACKLLITKHFHGVLAGSQPPYLLKLRYGKVRSLPPDPPGYAPSSDPLSPSSPPVGTGRRG